MSARKLHSRRNFWLSFKDILSETLREEERKKSQNKKICYTHACHPHICTHIYIHIHVHTCEHTQTYTYACTHTNTHWRMYECMRVYVCLCYFFPLTSFSNETYLSRFYLNVCTQSKEKTGNIHFQCDNATVLFTKFLSHRLESQRHYKKNKLTSFLPAHFSTYMSPAFSGLP